MCCLLYHSTGDHASLSRRSRGGSGGGGRRDRVGGVGGKARVNGKMGNMQKRSLHTYRVLNTPE